MSQDFQFSFDERPIDDDLGGDIREFASLPACTCFRIGSKFCCIRSTPTEIRSISENDFESFASTGVNTAVTQKATFSLNAP
jgi:hypothetical protein